MGTTGGNRIAEVLHSSNPQRYDTVDRVFGLGFVLVFVGAFTVYWTESPVVMIAAMVGMVLGFCVMVLCMGFEDVLGEKKIRDAKGEGSDTFKGFEGGDAFDEDGGPRRRREEPKRRF